MLRVLQVLSDVSIGNQLYKNDVKPASPIAKIQFCIPEKGSTKLNGSNVSDQSGGEINNVQYDYKEESCINNSSEESINSNKQLVKLRIYDVLGHEVATLVDEPLSPGFYEVDWYGPCFANKYTPGVYFYQVCTTGETNMMTDSLKMLIIK